VGIPMMRALDIEDYIEFDASPKSSTTERIRER
jgi:hypothetical protein